MNWRWISLAALLAALVIGYGAFNDRSATPASSSGPPRLPGYYLHDAVITETQNDGSVGIRLIARRIEQRPSDDSIAISDVRVSYFQAPGKEWLLSAQRGLVPADSRIVQFEGDVELRPGDAPDAFLRTEALAIDTERNVAYGLNPPVELNFGQHALTVQNFTADLNTEKLHLETVNGRFRSP
ncbi:MAG: LPS export ABC transporter periplasmic protein LptC [Steroidobacter sp.]